MVTQDTAAYPAAPLEIGALREVLRPFRESRMLPPEAYIDPAVFESVRHLAA